MDYLKYMFEHQRTDLKKQLQWGWMWNALK